MIETCKLFFISQKMFFNSNIFQFVLRTFRDLITFSFKFTERKKERKKEEESNKQIYKRHKKIESAVAIVGEINFLSLQAKNVFDTFHKI